MCASHVEQPTLSQPYPCPALMALLQPCPFDRLPYLYSCLPSLSPALPSLSPAHTLCQPCPGLPWPALLPSCSFTLPVLWPQTLSPLSVLAQLTPLSC